MSRAHRVVLLLATNYSGSHLLSHLLSAHPRCFGVGELARYHQLIANLAGKPVVAQYSDPMYEPLADAPVHTWHGLLCSGYARDEGVSDPVLVDNSKKVKWALRVADAGDVDLRFVHLLRDPRALVLRWRNTYDTDRTRRRQRLRVARRMPARAARILRGDLATVYVYKWLRENRQITNYLRSIDPQGTRSRVVTYHDIVFETEAALAGLMPALDLEFDPQQLRFGESRHLGTTKLAHADTVSRSEIRPDVKWTEALTDAERAAVETNSDVAEYLAQLDLSLGAQGLVRGD